MVESMVVYLVRAIEAHTTLERRTVKIAGHIAFVKEFHQMPRPIRCHSYNYDGHYTSPVIGAPRPVATCTDAHATGRDDKTITSCRKDESRTLHGWTTRDFPNCFWVQIVQAALSPNFLHVKGEQAEHLTYVITECEKPGIRTVEPTA
ncbi:hypothetical protein Z517_09387 [Fonsecaea pedrosoi CBS 271.37]|uniref:Uncharacterized protein n=1 Tax=Fonsecaea pedrosoi CBS 271.37 TaxID=1442368 RepID=A0A0D2G8D9_9EURO|nr:uncharacterized protein Z517_09387 [Fonsecaea pedrosoi CBS 271.37]KIW76943.1 hypothetical protein Z517_09387 [Fonsecaea pedrosoi CBS 271.37]